MLIQGKTENKGNNTSFLPRWISETMNVVWLFNSQSPLNLNLTKYVLYINCFELKVISVDSGTVKFKYAIKIWEQHFHMALWRYYDFILYKISISPFLALKNRRGERWNSRDIAPTAHSVFSEKQLSTKKHRS